MTKLISPKGVKLTVNPSTAAALVRRGYKLVEEPKPAETPAPRRSRKSTRESAPKEA